MIKFADLAAEYKSLWDAAAIRPKNAQSVRAAANQLRDLKATYDQVSAATNHIPWFVIGLIHSLEASFNLNAHLHNGDPLSAHTVQVPSGRPKTGSPPFSWITSAIDALTMHGMQNIGKDGWSIERISFELERYNGFGYRRNHPAVKSPYLWSCTNHGRQICRRSQIQHDRGERPGRRNGDSEAVGCRWRRRARCAS